MTSDSLAMLGPDSMVGSYRIVKEIGRGGMATVYEAVHTILPRRAAIKVMHGDLRRHPGMASRMVQEAAILEDLRHPGIVRVYECNILPDLRPWIAMGLVDGETLASRLHYASRLPAVEVATLLAEVSDVLAAVHSGGIVHRDLKPDNLLLTPSDREFPLRVIDWGVARLGPAGRLTLDGLTPGTPIYMSPEQATGKNIGAPCDIYSLGVIAYEALTGHPPFDGRTLAEVVCMHLTSEPAALRGRCDAPPALCDLVLRMLDKDQALRPSTIEVRKASRALANELASTLYEAFEVTGTEMAAIEQPAADQPAADQPARFLASRRRARAMIIPSDEVVVVDPEALEFGNTELLPIVRKPRWTPDLSSVGLPPQAARQPITPRGERDQLGGEVVLLDKRRS